jgi:hypothetical protein
LMAVSTGMFSDRMLLLLRLRDKRMLCHARSFFDPHSIKHMVVTNMLLTCEWVLALSNAANSPLPPYRASPPLPIGHLTPQCLERRCS